MSIKACFRDRNPIVDDNDDIDCEELEEREDPRREGDGTTLSSLSDNIGYCHFIDNGSRVQADISSLFGDWGTIMKQVCTLD